MMFDRSSYRLALLVMAYSAWSGCNNGPSGPERDSPMIEVLFPSGGEYDRDGDGLVDIEVTFTDTGSGINSESVTIESSRPLGPSETGGRDLIAAFHILERDSLHIILEETTQSILPGGPIDLTIRVADRLGNTAEAVAAIELPAGAFHTRLESPHIVGEPIAIEVLPDGSLGFLFVPATGQAIPFDVRELRFFDPIDLGISDPFGAAYDIVTDRIYIVDILDNRVAILNPDSRMIEGYILISSGGNRITRGPDGMLYVSLRSFSTSVSVIDPVQRRELRVIDLGYVDTLNPGEPALLSRVCWLSGEDNFFVSRRVLPGGVLKVAPDGTTLESYDLDPDSERLGFAFEILCDDARNLVYAADLNGLHAIDPLQGSVVQRINQRDFDQSFSYMDLSPSGRRLAVAVHAFFPEFQENWLIDLSPFTFLERFQTTTGDPGDEEVAFRPDGQLLFSASRGVAVYLNRE
jgi:DNA-binding beta-propeller fold protein YncE